MALQEYQKTLTLQNYQKYFMGSGIMSFHKKGENMKFKVGDKVRCIDDSYLITKELELGKVYEIEKINIPELKINIPELLKLKNVEKYWSSDRFKLVEKKPLKISLDFETKGLKKYKESMRKYGKSHALTIQKAINELRIAACQPKEIEMDNTYTFRGKINIDHLINDCLKDSKPCFLAISKDKAIVGISKQLPIKDKCDFTNQLSAFNEEDIQRSFYIVHIGKSDISLAIKELQRVSRLIRNRARNTAKKLHKNSKLGKYSKQPETKVMVF